MEQEKEKQIQEIRTALKDLRNYRPQADYPHQIDNLINIYEDKLQKLLKN